MIFPLTTFHFRTTTLLYFSSSSSNCSFGMNELQIELERRNKEVKLESYLTNALIFFYLISGFILRKNVENCVSRHDDNLINFFSPKWHWKTWRSYSRGAAAWINGESFKLDNLFCLFNCNLESLQTNSFSLCSVWGLYYIPEPFPSYYRVSSINSGAKSRLFGEKFSNNRLNHSTMKTS